MTALKQKFIWLSMLAVALVAVSGLGATTASAAFELSKTQECKAGKFIDFCWAETATSALLELIGEEEFEILPTGSTAKLSATLSENKVEIECTKTSVASPNNKIAQVSPLTTNYSIPKLVIKFEGCELLGALGEKCKVPASEPTNPLVGKPTSAEDIVFTPEKAGGAFIPIKFEEKNKCPATIKGEKLVKGEQLCLFKQFAEQLEEQILTCAASGLTLAEQPATYESKLSLHFVNQGTDLIDISAEA